MERIWKILMLFGLAIIYLPSFLVVTHLTETWSDLLEDSLGL